jgi:hypothetical protein
MLIESICEAHISKATGGFSISSIHQIFAQATGATFDMTGINSSRTAGHSLGFLHKENMLASPLQRPVVVIRNH